MERRRGERRVNLVIIGGGVVGAKLWNNDDSWRTRGSWKTRQLFFLGPVQQKSSKRSRLKFHLLWRRLFSMICVRVGQLTGLLAMVCDEVTFCDGWTTCLVSPSWLRFQQTQVGQKCLRVADGMACYCRQRLYGTNLENFSSPKLGPFSTQKNGPPKSHLCCGGISADGIQIDWIMFSLRRRNVITTWWALSTEKHSPPRHVRVQTAPFLAARCEFSKEAGMERQM